MNIMNLPGFTAETSLYTSHVHYRSRADTPNGLTAGAVTGALIHRKAKEASVDCGTFPDNVACNECNSTGPGTFNCCELRGMRHPGDSCIIVNDPNALEETPPTFPTFSGNLRELGNSVLRLR